MCKAYFDTNVWLFGKVVVSLQDKCKEMKKNDYSFRYVAFLLVVLLLTACGGDSGKFKLEGRLRNINQGEFWVYSTPRWRYRGFRYHCGT